MLEIEGIDALEGSELLQETFLFQFLNFDETMAMSAICHKEDAPDGAVIIEEGALGQGLFLIVDGEVKVYKGSGDDREELATLGRGELFGEMSLIENELTSASVLAHGNVSMLAIKRGDIENLMEENREIALKVYKTFCHTLSERLRKTSKELLESRHKD